MNNFTFKSEWIMRMSDLTKEERDCMIILIVRYALDLEPGNIKCANTSIFESIADDIDKEREKKESISNKRKAAGSIGGKQKVANAKQMLSKCQDDSKCLANASIYNNIITTNNTTNNISTINNNSIANNIISMDYLLSNIFRYNICCSDISCELIRSIKESKDIRYKGLVYFYEAMQVAYKKQDDAICNGMPIDDFVKFLIVIEVDMLRYIAMRFTNSPIQSIDFIHQLCKDAHAMSGGDAIKASEIIAKATANKQLSFRYGNKQQSSYSYSGGIDFNF